MLNVIDRSSTPRLPAIDLVRVIAIFFVMLIHSQADLNDPETYFFKGFLGCGAVPAFFLLSGFLGIRRIQTSSSFTAYARDKLRTLGIPYLFWSLLTLGAVFVVKSSAAPGFMRGEGNYLNVEPTVAGIASALFGIGRNPIVYQFWFLRDLIIISLLSYFAIRHIKPLRVLAPLFLLIPHPLFSSMGFFLIGCQLKPWFETKRDVTRLEVSVYCGSWCVLGAISSFAILTIPTLINQIGSAVFFGFLAWLLSTTRMGCRLASLGAASFFIYAVHEPTQSILVKLWEFTHLPLLHTFFQFIAIPVFVFASCAIVYEFVKRLHPAFLQFATGNR